MLFSSVLIYISLVAIALHSVEGFSFIVPAGEQRCFYELLEKGDNLRVSFQVAEGGHLDVDFSVSFRAMRSIGLMKPQSSENVITKQQKTRSMIGIISFYFRVVDGSKQGSGRRHSKVGLGHVQP